MAIAPARRFASSKRSRSSASEACASRSDRRAPRCLPTESTSSAEISGSSGFELASLRWGLSRRPVGGLDRFVANGAVVDPRLERAGLDLLTLELGIARRPRRTTHLAPRAHASPPRSVVATGDGRRRVEHPRPSSSHRLDEPPLDGPPRRTPASRSADPSRNRPWAVRSSSPHHGATGLGGVVDATGRRSVRPKLEDPPRDGPPREALAPPAGTAGPAGLAPASRRPPVARGARRSGGAVVRHGSPCYGRNGEQAAPVPEVIRRESRPATRPKTHEKHRRQSSGRCVS